MATYNIATKSAKNRHTAFIPNLSLASKFKRQRGFEMLAPSEGPEIWNCTILVTCQSKSTFASRKSRKFIKYIELSIKNVGPGGA